MKRCVEDTEALVVKGCQKPLPNVVVPAVATSRKHFVPEAARPSTVGLFVIIVPLALMAAPMFQPFVAGSFSKSPFVIQLVPTSAFVPVTSVTLSMYTVPAALR